MKDDNVMSKEQLMSHLHDFGKELRTLNTKIDGIQGKSDILETLIKTLAEIQTTEFDDLEVQMEKKESNQKQRYETLSTKLDTLLLRMEQQENEMVKLSQLQNTLFDTKQEKQSKIDDKISNLIQLQNNSLAKMDKLENISQIQITKLNSLDLKKDNQISSSELYVKLMNLSKINEQMLDSKMTVMHELFQTRTNQSGLENVEKSLDRLNLNVESYKDAVNNYSVTQIQVQKLRVGMTKLSTEVIITIELNNDQCIQFSFVL